MVRNRQSAIANRQSAFTLLELLLAAAITVVMVLFLHTIFQSVAGTVSLGLATSEIIRSNTDFTRQISADADAMVGPLDGGFLVVLQKELTGVQLRPQDAANATVRADQVAWIRSVSGDPPPSPATPASAGSFSQATSTATHARIWYGHVLHTDAASTSEPITPGGPSGRAIDWILGRQLLFLDPAPTSPHIQFTTGATIGYETDPTAPVNPRWYMGLSDVLDADLPGILAAFNADPLNPLYPQGPYQFTYGARRLWCNPEPPAGAAAAAWRVAQMHPYYIGGVSDLRIDFAGSYDGLGGIGITLLDGQIKWYSHFYNNPTEGQPGPKPYNSDEPTTYKPPLYTPPALSEGFIPAHDPTDTVPRAIYQVNPLTHADGAFTFRPGGLDWPHMLRIRYRVHDPQGQLADRDAAPGKIFERIIKVRGL